MVKRQTIEVSEEAPIIPKAPSNYSQGSRRKLNYCDLIYMNVSQRSVWLYFLFLTGWERIRNKLKTSKQTTKVIASLNDLLSVFFTEIWRMRTANRCNRRSWGGRQKIWARNCMWSFLWNFKFYRMGWIWVILMQLKMQHSDGDTNTLSVMYWVCFCIL